MLKSYSTKVFVMEVDTSHLRKNTNKNKAKRSKTDSGGPPLHTLLKGHKGMGKGRQRDKKTLEGSQVKAK